MMPALVIFDCDGVLIDSEAIACRVLRDVLAEAGAVYDLEEVAERFTGWSDATVAAVVAEERGIVLSESFPHLVAQRAVAAFESDLQAVGGAHALLSRFAWPKCVASNSAMGRLERSLEIAGLRDFFAKDAVFSADLVARPKPEPDLHLHAARTMGAPPDLCLVIEDSPSGVRAARAAGMTVCGFTGAGEAGRAKSEELRDLGACAVIGNLIDVPEVIAALDEGAPTYS